MRQLNPSIPGRQRPLKLGIEPPQNPQSNPFTNINIHHPQEEHVEVTKKTPQSAIACADCTCHLRFEILTCKSVFSFPQFHRLVGADLAFEVQMASALCTWTVANPVQFALGMRRFKCNLLLEWRKSKYKKRWVELQCAPGWSVLRCTSTLLKGAYITPPQNQQIQLHQNGHHLNRSKAEKQTTAKEHHE